MKRTRTDAAPDRRADRHRQGLSPPVVRGGQIVDDLVESAGDEIRILYFQDGPEALYRQSHAGPDSPAFDNGSIPNPVGSECFRKSLRNFEYAAVFCNILPQQEYGGIFLHSLPEPLRNGVYVPFRNACSPVGPGQLLAERFCLRKHAGAFRFEGAFGCRLDQCIFDVLFNLPGNAHPDAFQLILGSASSVQRLPRKPLQRVPLRPLGEQHVRHVGRTGGLLMPPHPEGFHFEKRWTGPAARQVRSLPHRPDHFQDIVAVHHDAGHPVPGGGIGNVSDRHRLFHRRRKAVSIVLDRKEHRQFPYARKA